MKHTNVCSKCGDSRILEVKDVFGDRSINLVLGFLSTVPVTRYVCATCGFVESWVDENYLNEVKERYQRENPGK